MAEPITDTRILWMRDKICGLLRGKFELFDKLFNVEEEGDKIKRFVNEDSCQLIFFTGTAKDMAVYSAFPMAHRKKVVFFQKTHDYKLDEKKMDDVLDHVVVRARGSHRGRPRAAAEAHAGGAGRRLRSPVEAHTAVPGRPRLPLLPTPR